MARLLIRLAPGLSVLRNSIDNWNLSHKGNYDLGKHAAVGLSVTCTAITDRPQRRGSADSGGIHFLTIETAYN